MRIPKRRKGRSPDEDALRGAFRTFFSNAQWVGDGSQVPVEVDGETFVFNVELNVDAYSGAFVGADISPVEDSAAVIATFHNSVEDAGTYPMAILFDNKPSNHTHEVDVALDGTLRIRSTSYRAQNRAHVEGGFGLLKPTLEGLTLESGSPETLAASYLHNLVTAAARAVNQRPRRDRGGKSRLDLLLAVATTSRLERLFWLTAIADVVNTQANDDRHRLFRLCARRIAATYALSPRDRTASIRFLAAKIIELN